MSAVPETVAGRVPVRFERLPDYVEPRAWSPPFALDLVRNGNALRAVDPALWARYVAVRDELASLVEAIRESPPYRLALTVTEPAE